MLNFLFNPIKTIFSDAPENWQIGFQDPASPGFTGILDLHDSLMFYLIVVCVAVFIVLGSCNFIFNSFRSSLIHKYLNHGTLIETVWTILPALILIAIAFPSFRLMYLLDCLFYNITDIKLSFRLLSRTNFFLLSRRKAKKNNTCVDVTFEAWRHSSISLLNTSPIYAF